MPEAELGMPYANYNDSIEEKTIVQNCCACVYVMRVCVRTYVLCIRTCVLVSVRTADEHYTKMP